MIVMARSMSLVQRMNWSGIKMPMVMDMVIQQ